MSDSGVLRRGNVEARHCENPAFVALDRVAIARDNGNTTFTTTTRRPIVRPYNKEEP